MAKVVQFLFLIMIVEILLLLIRDVLSMMRTTYLNTFKIFVFRNNTESKGSTLWCFGGLLYRCIPVHAPGDEFVYVLGQALTAFNSISDYNSTHLDLSSEVVKVCFCTDGSKPDCNLREINGTKMRGETVKVTIAGLDQYRHPLKSFIKASYRQISTQLDKGEERKELFDQCEEVPYHVFSTQSEATLILEPDRPCGQSLFSTITVNITVIPCSNGFEQIKDRCVCDRRLTEYLNITVCDVDSQFITKKRSSIWLRYDEQYLKMYSNCPLDYCRAYEDTISILSPDNQCAHRRSGVMCGACKDNYSIVLGGSKCLPCTSKYTFVGLIVIFAVVGAVLVIFLLIGNITISSRLLNGSIFYANVISISGLTNLQNCSIHPMLSVFIAWINLDLGIEVCFYSGMNTYMKTWLQFPFPFYIWSLVGVIITVSYYHEDIW